MPEVPNTAKAAPLTTTFAGASPHGNWPLAGDFRARVVIDNGNATLEVESLHQNRVKVYGAVCDDEDHESFGPGRRRVEA